MSPAVSVTIISYNQAHLLREALDSALAQDFRDFEIVVSDDASTDQSVEVLRQYHERNPERIRPLFNDRNGGLAANRDRAMKASRGEFIAWLDADDVWEPQKLTRQVALMRSEPNCALSYHNMLLLKGGELTGDRYINPPMPPTDESYQTLIRYENHIPSSSVMFRAALLGNTGYHFGGRTTFSDYHFFVRMASQGSLLYLPECLGRYRRHEASAMSKADHVRSPVRKRREQALKAMLQEFPQARPLLRYALARFYVSQLSRSVRQSEPATAFSSGLALLGLMPQSLAAARDRRLKRNLLTGFEY